MSILHDKPQFASPIIRIIIKCPLDCRTSSERYQHRNVDIKVISKWHIQLGLSDLKIRYLSHVECSTSYRLRNFIVQTKEFQQIDINPTPVAIPCQGRNAHMEFISEWHICHGFAILILQLSMINYVNTYQNRNSDRTSMSVWVRIIHIGMVKIIIYMSSYIDDMKACIPNWFMKTCQLFCEFMWMNTYHGITWLIFFALLTLCAVNTLPSRGFPHRGSLVWSFVAWLMLFALLVELWCQIKDFLIVGPVCSISIGSRWTLLTKDLWCDALMYSFMFARTSYWTNSTYAIEMKIQGAHVILLLCAICHSVIDYITGPVCGTTNGHHLIPPKTTVERMFGGQVCGGFKIQEFKMFIQGSDHIQVHIITQHTDLYMCICLCGTCLTHSWSTITQFQWHILSNDFAGVSDRSINRMCLKIIGLDWSYRFIQGPSASNIWLVHVTTFNPNQKQFHRGYKVLEAVRFHCTAFCCICESIMVHICNQKWNVIRAKNSHLGHLTSRVYMYMYVGMYVCMYACMYIYLCRHVLRHTYIHLTYIHTSAVYSFSRAYVLNNLLPIMGDYKVRFGSHLCSIAL